MSRASRLRQHLWVWLVLASYATLAFLLAPGWFFFDSATQWGWAHRIATDGWPARLGDYDITTQWPIANVLVRIPFAAMPLGPATWAALQAMATVGAVVALTHALGWRGKTAASVVVLAIPVTWNYALFHSADAPTAIALAVGLALVVEDSPVSRRRFTGVVICAVVIALFRHTGLPSAAMLLALIVYRSNAHRLRRAAVGALALILVVGGTRAIATTAFPRDISGQGILMRVVEINARVPSPAIDARLAPFVTQPHASLGDECLDDGIWCDEVQSRFAHTLIVAHGSEISSAFVRAALRHPIAAAAVLGRFASYSVGLVRPLPETEMGRHDDVPVPFDSVRMTFDATRERALALHFASQSAGWDMLGRPWLLVLLAAGALVWLRTDRFAVLAFLVLCAAHAAPFILAAPASDYRYMWPITLSALTVLVAGLCEAVSMMRGRHGRTRHDDVT